MCVHTEYYSQQAVCDDIRDCIVCRKDSRFSFVPQNGHTVVVCALLEAKADSNVTKNVIAQDA